MRNGSCPKCGYASVRSGRGTMYVGTHPSTNTAHVFVPGQALPGSAASPIDVYLCTYCGYFEQYLGEPAALQFAEAHWGKVEPA